MNVKKGMFGLMAALTLLCAPAVYADNNTEFGIEDDLTVLGNGGTLADPDVEIKGFSVFGATQVAPPLQIPVAPGNVFVNGYVQISSGLYVAAPSTFTATVNLPAPGSIYVTGGTNGQVLSKDGTTGTLKWNDVSSMVSGDNLGNHVATTTLNMNGFGLVNVASVTATGYITTASSVTVGGAAGIAGALSVNGDVDLNAKLNVDGTSTFVSSVTALGNVQLGDGLTDTHAVNMAPAANTALSVAGQDVSGDYSAKFYSGANLAAWIRKK
ncbi:MAG: hypothetical protein M0025_12565 [Elusimicrobia bacterium]|nr:hypothetical protein [Elusimicrobiota bacterium]